MPYPAVQPLSQRYICCRAPTAFRLATLCVASHCPCAGLILQRSGGRLKLCWQGPGSMIPAVVKSTNGQAFHFPCCRRNTAWSHIRVRWQWYCSGLAIVGTCRCGCFGLLLICDGREMVGRRVTLFLEIFESSSPTFLQPAQHAAFVQPIKAP